jgi:hypothetical protein
MNTPGEYDYEYYESTRYGRKKRRLEVVSGELLHCSQVLLHVHEIHARHLVEDVPGTAGVQTLHPVKKESV